MIYLDYASHTPANKEVLAEFSRVELKSVGNALSAHKPGRTAMEELERATVGIASLIGVQPNEVIFTSGASEANNLAVKGIARAHIHKGKHIISTCLEHPSISGALAFLQESGYEVELVRIQKNGEVDLDHLQSLLRTDTILLCISAVDSELGAVQPLKDIVDLIQGYPNCKLHVDGAQAVGKIKLDGTQVQLCGNKPGSEMTTRQHRNTGLCSDTFSFSPHKFYGLGGFGVLVKREGLVLEPMIHGGGLSLYRSGTPSPAMAAACYKAMLLSYEHITERFQVVSSHRQYIIDRLKPCYQVYINSPDNGSPYILNLSVKGIKGTDMQREMDLRDIAVSVKSACSVAGAPSRPVLAVTGDKQRARCSWRLSLSHLTTIQELDAFLAAFNEIAGEQQR